MLIGVIWSAINRTIDLLLAHKELFVIILERLLLMSDSVGSNLVMIDDVGMLDSDLDITPGLSHGHLQSNGPD